MSGVASRILFIIVVVAAVALGAYWLFWPASLPAFDPANRVVHPFGYSLVKPANFEVNIGKGHNRAGDNMVIYDPLHSKPAPSLAAQSIEGEPDWEQIGKRGFKPGGKYKGHDAWIMTGPTGRGRAATWNHRAVVKFGDKWFEIGVADPGYFDIDKSGWRPYFESFEYNAPATQPTTTQGG